LESNFENRVKYDHEIRVGPRQSREQPSKT
jgi:hypothetical protein